MEKSWAELGMEAGYKSCAGTGKKLGKSCAEAGKKAGKKLRGSWSKSWEKAGQLLCRFFPASDQLFFTRKIWAKACIKDGEELGRTWYESLV